MKLIGSRLETTIYRTVGYKDANEYHMHRDKMRRQGWAEVEAVCDPRVSKTVIVEYCKIKKQYE